MGEYWITLSVRGPREGAEALQQEIHRLAESHQAVDVVGPVELNEDWFSESNLTAAEVASGMIPANNKAITTGPPLD